MSDMIFGPHIASIKPQILAAYSLPKVVPFTFVSQTSQVLQSFIAPSAFIPKHYFTLNPYDVVPPLLYFPPDAIILPAAQPTVSATTPVQQSPEVSSTSKVKRTRKARKIFYQPEERRDIFGFTKQECKEIPNILDIKSYFHNHGPEALAYDIELLNFIIGESSGRSLATIPSQFINIHGSSKIITSLKCLAGKGIIRASGAQKEEYYTSTEITNTIISSLHTLRANKLAKAERARQTRQLIFS